MNAVIIVEGQVDQTFFQELVRTEDIQIRTPKPEEGEGKEAAIKALPTFVRVPHPELASLGITDHSVEDYLVKACLANPPADMPDWENFLKELSAILNRYGKGGSSKVWFQLLKPFMGLPAHDSGPTGAVAKLFRSSGRLLDELSKSLLEYIKLLGVKG